MTAFEDWWSGYFHEINSQKATALAAWKAAQAVVKDEHDNEVLERVAVDFRQKKTK
jgi:hypothetical protein